MFPAAVHLVPWVAAEMRRSEGEDELAIAEEWTVVELLLALKAVVDHLGEAEEACQVDQCGPAEVSYPGSATPVPLLLPLDPLTSGKET